MKKIMFFLMLLTLGLFTSCMEEEHSQQTDLYIYFDFTEGQNYAEQIEADMDKYIALLGVDATHPANFGTIKIYPLHDISAGKSKSVKLKAGKSSFEANKFLRQKEITTFQGKLKDKMVEINETFTGKELSHSHIFSPICKGVRKLNKSDANHKVILIYSDMLENSNLANFHNKKLSYESMKTKFDEACGMDDAADVEVFIVHPVDKNYDHKIQNAANLWSKYLMDKGLEEDAFHFDTVIDI